MARVAGALIGVRSEFGFGNGSVRATLTRQLAVALAIGVTASTLVCADDDIAMSEAQMRAIGIQWRTLNASSGSSGIAYPARAVLPREKEQIVSSSVAGVVDQVLVDDHAQVRADQPLLRLNSPEFGELQLKLLEATHQSRLGNSTLSRERALVSEGIVPARRALEAEAAAANANAAVKQARAAIRLAGADEATVARIAAGHVQDRLELRAARASTVLSIDVKPGQRVADADPLLRLGELGTLWLDIDLPAARADDWDAAATLRVVGRDVTAKPLSVSADLNGASTARLRAEVIPGGDRLRPGEFVQVQVPMRIDSKAWTLPNAAVIHQDDRTVVFVRTTQGFTVKNVTTVGESADEVSVTGPLDRGDAVAVAGAIALKAAWLGASGGEED